MRRASVMVPTALEAHGNATTRVRSDSLPLEVAQVERRVVVDVHELHDQAAVLGGLEPGRDVAVVVEARDEDLVALGEVARGRRG